MNNELKQIIANEVADVAAQSSQNKVAKRAGVSSATISQMINNNWELIAPEMWRKVQAKLRINTNWKICTDVTNYKTITDLLLSAQSKGMAIGFSYAAGRGKSEAYRAYSRKYKNVIYVECKNSWSKKSYIKALLVAAGLDANGTTEELIERFTDHLITLEKPKVIIDQADKLKDASLDLFMDWYNDLDGFCSFVISGVPALEKRIRSGLQRNKIGYAEFWSRIGGKFIPLDETSYNDVAAICKANGMLDVSYINEAYNLANGDLRVVKRQVEKYFLVQDAKKRLA